MTAVVPTLDKLAKTANHEHALVQRTGAEMLNHAILSGDALVAAKDRVGWGGWLDWLGVNFDGTPQTARLYMRLARHREVLQERRIQSLTSAENYLKDNATTFTEQKQEAERLRASGMSVTQIAQLFGVSTVSVYHWLNPHYRTAKQKRAHERREAAAMLRQQERDKAMRRVGGDLSKAYIRVRNLATLLDDAWRAETDQDAQESIGKALDHLYHVEDELVRATRLSYPELKAVLTAKRGD